MALSMHSSRWAKSQFGVARKAEKRASELALMEPTEANLADAVEATVRSRDARTNFEVERAHEMILAISGPTTGEQRGRLGRAVRATKDGQS